MAKNLTRMNTAHALQDEETQATMFSQWLRSSCLFIAPGYIIILESLMPKEHFYP